MQKIEEKIVTAIRAGKSMTCGNSCVSVTTDAKTGKPSRAMVFLHGNHIMTWDYRKHDFTHVSDCGWATTTTQSRLNACFNGMGINKVYVRRGDKRVIGYSWGKVYKCSELPRTEKQFREDIIPDWARRRIAEHKLRLRAEKRAAA